MRHERTPPEPLPARDEDPGDLAGCERSRVRFLPPIGTAAALFARARKFGLAEGCRFQTREGRKVILRAASPRGAGAAPNRPVAAFSVRWRSPDGRHATVAEVGWNPRASSEEEAWRAIDLLRGAADA